MQETEDDIRGSEVDKSEELAGLRNELSSLQESIKDKIERINDIKIKLDVDYRHKDKEKYELEHRELAKSLWELGIQQDKIKARIKELED
jgi:uncharacterized protein YlxW (UPF0749 family)